MTSTPGRQVSVRMGELAVSDDPQATLTVIGLGSCVAMAIFSPEQHMAGLAHVVLPDSAMAPAGHATPGKFADTAVPALVERLRAKGGKRFLMRAALVGGSAMFGDATKSRITAVGVRNIDALTAALGEAGIRLVASDVGGMQGRSIQVMVGAGRVVTRAATREAVELYPAGASAAAVRPILVA